ncbi:MAG: polyprenyl synthetase family protein [Bacteroidota bacterium]|nr:polyprenyl synthetase family protein [Bacteroidota bacterium]
MHSFKEFQNIISQEIKNLKINKFPRELYEPIEYILDIGGKRLRPVITLMVCELFDGDINKAKTPAIGMEIFHNFTLMHDDIMDKADIRRGKTTVHKKWDKNRAILSGDAMLIVANQLMLETDDDILREVMVLYNKSGLLVCDGQQYDMNFELSKNISIPDYMKMIELKTASLISGCCKLGAVLAKTSEENKNLIEEFGYNLGISFQLEDDCLDTFGNENIFGKQIGGDILANKKTYLYLKAYELADKNTKKELEQWYSTTTHKEKEKIKAVLNIFNKLKVKDKIRSKSKQYFYKAIKNLDSIKVSQEKKKNLLDLSNYLVNRDY